MASQTFNIGFDAQLVLVGPFGRVDLSHVKEWDTKQMTKEIKVTPLNGPPIFREIPDGWEFSFKIERNNNAADDLINRIETAYYNGASLQASTLYAYYAETDGSTSSYEYQGVALKLNNAGSWKQESAVEMVLEGKASRRIRV